MTATVKALGYAIIGTEDLDDWVAFGADLLGMQVAHRDEERLLLRIDHYAYRLDVRRGEPGARALGWETGGPEALAELAQRLTDAGYDVEQASPELCEERRVMDLVRFRDPEGLIDHELYWGMRSETAKFVSPRGHTFVADELGLGHAFMALHQGKQAHDTLFKEIFGFRLSDHIDMPSDVGTFLHCNPRHHSFAYANAPHRKPGIGHLMFEIDDLDALGRAWDAVQEADLVILSTLGKHTNDEMISFYVRTPSGFGLEFGVGGILIDDETWVPVRYDSAHYWGHKRPVPVE